MIIDGGQVYTTVDGKETAKTALHELLNIEPGKNTGSILLENGSKLTFVFTTAEDQDPVLQEMHITHPDGSNALVKDISNPEELNLETIDQDEPFIPKLDDLVPDGYTLFMDPTGLALYELTPEDGGAFKGIFGDERALTWPLSAFSFGGNIYNFYFSYEQQEWRAQQNIPKFQKQPTSPKRQPISVQR